MKSLSFVQYCQTWNININNTYIQYGM